MQIKDLTGLSEPLTKLIEVVSKGIGMIYEPIHIKRMAKAKVEEIETISSVIKSLELPIEYNNGQISIDTSTREFMERTERRMLFIELKKQQNIEDIIDGAYRNLENEKSVSQQPLQEEWINRFFSIVGEISSEDLKIIWSKVLSEEIRTPGKYSIRTLEVLKNLSTEEAKIFEKVSNYIIKAKGQYYIPEEYELLKDIDVCFEEILVLREALLVNSSTVYFDDTDLKELLYNNKKFFCKKRCDTEIYFSVFVLTEAGRDIFNILVPNFNNDYITKYVEILKEKLEVECSENV